MSDPFDWVAARSECSVFNVFVKLKAEIEADIKARNVQLQAEEKQRVIGLVVTSAVSFAVTLTGNGIPHRTVSFSLIGEVIVFRDDQKDVSIAATLTLNDKGECRLKIGNDERESWQFRRTTLENLFWHAEEEGR